MVVIALVMNVDNVHVLVEFIFECAPMVEGEKSTNE